MRMMLLLVAGDSRWHRRRPHATPTKRVYLSINFFRLLNACIVTIVPINRHHCPARDFVAIEDRPWDLASCCPESNSETNLVLRNWPCHESGRGGIKPRFMVHTQPYFARYLWEFVGGMAWHGARSACFPESLHPLRSDRGAKDQFSIVPIATLEICRRYIVFAVVHLSSLVIEHLIHPMHAKSRRIY